MIAAAAGSVELGRPELRSFSRLMGEFLPQKFCAQGTLCWVS